MSDERSRRGGVEEFDSAWRERSEAHYNHWRRGPVRNQIQLAFRCHWEVFSELIGVGRPGRSLEVGCGRGSLSSYFADNGWDATLLDSSAEAIRIAHRIFVANEHRARFVVGDALELPFEDGSFDVVASIGLLEHFESPGIAIDEQWRVLKPGGWLFCYVVPERPDSIQRHFIWLNRLLAATLGRVGGRTASPKPAIYRSSVGSEAYIPHVRRHRPVRIVVSGMYPVPMISDSPEFPFSLLPPPIELALVVTFKAILALRRIATGRHGWLCAERTGLAFLVAAQRAAQ